MEQYSASPFRYELGSTFDVDFLMGLFMKVFNLCRNIKKKSLRGKKLSVSSTISNTNQSTPGKQKRFYSTKNMNSTLKSYSKARNLNTSRAPRGGLDNIITNV